MVKELDNLDKAKLKTILISLAKEDVNVEEKIRKMLSQFPPQSSPAKGNGMKTPIKSISSSTSTPTKKPPFVPAGSHTKKGATQSPQYKSPQYANVPSKLKVAGVLAPRKRINVYQNGSINHVIVLINGDLENVKKRNV